MIMMMLTILTEQLDCSSLMQDFEIADDLQPTNYEFPAEIEQIISMEG
jgi:hypothetical protein